MAITMKDIASELGVSVVTVSKVLRNHSDISAETRERVLKRVKELNYRPNLAARALVTGRTNSIGLVVPDLLHPFFAEVAMGLSGVLRKKTCSLLISSSEEDPKLEQSEIDQLLARRVDAMIIASTQQSVESFRRIEEQATPYVLIDRRIPGVNANFVGVDDERVGELATAHLIGTGCLRIAHISGLTTSTVLGRLEGYRRALAHHNIAQLPGYIVQGRSSDAAADASGYEAMRHLLTLNPRPDAVFCYNDPTAMGALQAILEIGLRVPEDVAVIGCGNVRYAEFLRVPLSSVDQHSRGIGERAAKLALALVGARGSRPRPKTILVEPKVVARDSTSLTKPAVSIRTKQVSPLGETISSLGQSAKQIHPSS